MAKAFMNKNLELKKKSSRFTESDEAKCYSLTKSYEKKNPLLESTRGLGVALGYPCQIEFGRRSNHPVTTRFMCFVRDNLSLFFCESFFFSFS